jgi:hypothetical protein
MVHLGLPTCLSVIESGPTALAFICPAHREASSATGDRQLRAQPGHRRTVWPSLKAENRDREDG